MALKRPRAHYPTLKGLYEGIKLYLGNDSLLIECET